MNQNLSLNKEKIFNSVEFKKFFLLKFTQELINNSMPTEVFKLKNIIKDEEKEKKEETKEKIKEIVKDKDMEISILSKEERLRNLNPPVPLIKRKSVPFDAFKKLKLIIPETRFPAHLQYLKPIPIAEEIELGKITPLIKDPFVRIIECDGPNQNLIVKGNMGIKRTNIILDKEEINEVIQKISKATKIPIQEGIFKVAVGKLIFLAIISEIIGSKFIIKKMFYKTGQTTKY